MAARGSDLDLNVMRMQSLEVRNFEIQSERACLCIAPVRAGISHRLGASPIFCITFSFGKHQI
jgi:hypothetical protein